MQTTDTALRAYRRRIVEAGDQEVLFRLSAETVALIDQIKKRHGLRNRGQVIEHEHSARELLKLFAQRRHAAQQQ